MRRQLVATTAAITTAAAIGFAVPAFGFHDDEPQLYTADDVQGGNVTCEFLGLVSFGEDGKVEFPLEGETEQPDLIEDIENYFDLESFDPPIVAVIVKAGNASYVYDEPPFVDLIGPGGKEISHIEVCGGEVETTTTTTTTTEKPTTPTTTTTEKPAAPTVPTEVPAGTDGDSGFGGPPGLLLGAIAVVAGLALVARRRFLHDS